MNIELIKKSIDEAIIKCGVSRKRVSETIQNTVKDITDNQEEYDLLMDIVPTFYKEHYNKPTETLIDITFDGKEFTSYGDEKNTVMDKEAEAIGLKDGLLLSIHNHPSTVCFPSVGDFIASSKVQSKYNIVIGVNGVFIYKTPIPMPMFENFYPTCRVACEDYQKAKVKEEYSDVFNDLDEKFKSGEISAEEAEATVVDLGYKWISKEENMIDSLNFLNNDLENDSYDTKCYYMPLKRS